MKVANMKSPRSGRPVANQFVIFGDNGSKAFQSYDSIIAIIQGGDCPTILDENFWDYSKTTGIYRNKFLGETKAETQKKIDTGVYILADLNGDNCV